MLKHQFSRKKFLIKNAYPQKVVKKKMPCYAHSDPKNEDEPKNEDGPKIKVDPKNEDNPKNGNSPKNEEDPKNEDGQKHEDYPINENNPQTKHLGLFCLLLLPMTYYSLDFTWYLSILIGSP